MKKITAINEAIQKAIEVATLKAAGRELQEPDYNAAIAIWMPPMINSSKTFPNVIFGGCFIHQSPKATFVGKDSTISTCEVGDLLAICHEVVDGDDRYNAALIQWKLLKAGIEKITGSALKQLDLYEHWPVFTLNTCPGQFDILPKTVSPGAQYGLILNSSSLSLACRIPSEVLRMEDSTSLARFIINFMKWQTGRPVELDAAQGNADEWSRLVEHLIKNSLGKRFKRANIDTKDIRASKELLKLLISHSGDNTSNSAVSNDSEHCIDGISIIFIEKDIDEKEKKD